MKTENAITQKIVEKAPSVLKAVVPVCEGVASSVANAIVTAKCRNQLALVEVVRSLSGTIPMICECSEKISEKYIGLAEKRVQNDGAVLKAIMDNSKCTIDQRVELVGRYENMCVENRLRIQDKVIDGIKVVGGTAIGCAGLVVMNTVIKENGKTSRSLAANLFGRR